jgi:acyl dehydratase
MTKDIFFEDISPGKEIKVGEYFVTAEDIINFAEAWDPLPIHTSPEIAMKSPFGGLTASGVHILAIKQKMLHQAPIMKSVICTLGFENVIFPHPLYAGSTVTLNLTWLSKRISKSKPDRGIVKLRLQLTDENGKFVLDYNDSILMKLRNFSE